MMRNSSNTHPFPDAGSPLSGDWQQRFIELQLRQLKGDQLVGEDAIFAAQFDLLETAFPGFLEDALLDYSVPESEVIDLPVAAASSPSALDHVARAIQSGDDSVGVEIAGRRLEVLRISLAENLVQPIFHEGYKFVVRRRDGRDLEITRLGGVYIGFEELKGMVLVVDSTANTISLSDLAVS